MRRRGGEGGVGTGAREGIRKVWDNKKRKKKRKKLKVTKTTNVK